MTEPLVKMRGITKRFGGVTALRGVDLDAYAGEVLAIVGDNGAGKSTLIKILTGVYQPTEGEMFLNGERVAFASHAEAIKQGIDAVYQTLALADHLDPPGNMFLGRITVAHDQMSLEEIDGLEQEAFRFSGVGALER